MKFKKTLDLNHNAIKILRDNQLLHIYEGLPNRGKKFINKAIRINQTGEPFTIHNFPEISKNTYKQYVFHLRQCDLVQVVSKTVFAYYKVPGFRLNRYWEKLTSNPTGVPINNNSDFNQENISQFLHDYLNSLDYPALHNIRLHFHRDFIYDQVTSYLSSKNTTIQFIPANKSIVMSPNFSWEPNSEAKIIITSKNLVQVMIKNTFKPLACTEEGIYELFSKLGEVRSYLSSFSSNLPTISNWYFVRADFGRDCKKPLNKLFPTMEFRDLSGALVRLYSKSWPDGQNRLRLEKIITPDKQLKDILESFVNVPLLT
ncbi:hypothetical protein [Nitrosopumilus adriaticus]|uniref:hypothetical protein n=1 Tax=Nitrosopumilus adriaticus TaxID=1580092 RepID=UPI00352D1E9A